MTTASSLVAACRPRQWIKNLLVFAAPVAAGVIDQGDLLTDTLAAFVAFCLAASGTYLLNDALDVESDRLHPTKRNRPIAAGQVPVVLAYVVAAVLVVAALAIAFLTRSQLGWTIAAYLALTTAYSFWLKHVAILDVIAVASGFVLRAVAGAAATGVPISEWFFIVTSFGALFMVAGKRTGETTWVSTRQGCGPPSASIRRATSGTCARWPRGSCWCRTASGRSSRPRRSPTRACGTSCRSCRSRWGCCATRS